MWLFFFFFEVLYIVFLVCFLLCSFCCHIFPKESFIQYLHIVTSLSFKGKYWSNDFKRFKKFSLNSFFAGQPVLFVFENYTFNPIEKFPPKLAWNTAAILFAWIIHSLNITPLSRLYLIQNKNGAPWPQLKQ